jgi:hypothetical protein
VQDVPLDREVDVLRSALSRVEQRLPAGWSLLVQDEVEIGGRRVDAVVQLRAPDGSTAWLLVEVKNQLATRDVSSALEQLSRARETLGSSEPTLAVLVARYLPAATRQQIVQRGAGYADATGNLQLMLGQPALFLRDVGATRDPWRGPGRPLGSLKGPPAARVVRALIDLPPPLSVLQLVKASGASTGATYRVVELLEGEGLIERRPRGPITDVKWRALLERWSADYGFQQSNSITACLQPRGLDALTSSLSANSDLRYVLTGALAIEPELSYAPPRLAMLYVQNTAEAIARLGLRPVDSGANVLLAATDYEVVFDRPQQIGGLRAAAKSQIAADLLTAPGRGPAEAQALIEWMSANEQAWRAR